MGEWEEEGETPALMESCPQLSWRQPPLPLWTSTSQGAESGPRSGPSEAKKSPARYQDNGFDFYKNFDQDSMHLHASEYEHLKTSPLKYSN